MLKSKKKYKNSTVLIRISAFCFFNNISDQFEHSFIVRNVVFNIFISGKFLKNILMKLHVDSSFNKFDFLLSVAEASSIS